jgi:hypothetical protein
MGLSRSRRFHGHCIPDADRTAGKNLTVNSAAAVRDEHLMQANVLLGVPCHSMK